MEIIIGIGEYAVTNNIEHSIKTYALASCIAVTAYCPNKRAGGMVHLVLPWARNEESVTNKPGYYAVIGVPLLINTLYQKYGCLKSGLIIKAFGGADSLNKSDIFKIGQRNIAAVEAVLQRMKLTLHRAELGGLISRTVELDIATGNVRMATQPIKI